VRHATPAPRLRDIAELLYWASERDETCRDRDTVLRWDAPGVAAQCARTALPYSAAAET